MIRELAEKVVQSVHSGKPLVWTGGHETIVPELVRVMLDFPEKPSELSVKVEIPKQYHKVILVSGGQDSTIMWHLNRNVEDKIGLYVDFGQAYKQKEIEAINLFGIQFREVEYQIGNRWNHIIPARNFILLMLAEELVAPEGEIWLGAVQGESAQDKGDKSSLFFTLFENFVWQSKHKRIHIRTLVEKTKNDWLKQYLCETGDSRILQTITCFDGAERPCGRCQACVRKWIAMRYCGVEDAESFFDVNPYQGGQEHVEKYRHELKRALEQGDFSHYSKDRAIQDLSVIEAYQA